MRKGFLVLLGAAMLTGAAAAGAQPQPVPDAAAARRFVSPTLTRFRSEAEFRAYLASIGVRFVGAEPPPPPRRPRRAPPLPPAPPGTQNVEVTGTRIRRPNIESNVPIVSVSADEIASGTPDNPSITNTQEANVDEGDIVKQVGRFLLVLQDGRVFSIDTAPGGRPGLALADRLNVYPNVYERTWYDEMIVYGDRVLITGYSYSREASQLSVLRVSPDGRLSHEGTFLLTSSDYYDPENYATRLVGDRLVIYTPLVLEQGGRFLWPTVRRWQAEDSAARKTPLFDARAVYRPLAPGEAPTLHTISVCQLGPAVRGLGCRTSAFIGPRYTRFYVTPTDAFLWASEVRWERNNAEPPCTRRARPTEVESAFVFRLGLPAGRLSVAGARGTPIDQLSLATIGPNLHALTVWGSQHCGGWDHPRGDLAFATIPLTAFGPTRADVPASAYVEVPGLAGMTIENRYNGDHLVYGGRPGWGSEPPAQAPEPQPLVVLPVGRPQDARTLDVSHGILRVERVGDDMVATGYRDRSGLEFTMVKLDGTPRLGATLHLEGRYESEGRSHAFNARPEADGSALMGIPTVPRSNDAQRWWFRSGASDLSFVSLTADGRLDPAGDLLRGENTGAGYRCEVSCIDWYGNSRPIFTGGRIFALTGTELIEGALERGHVRETRRLDIAAESTRGRR